MRGHCHVTNSQSEPTYDRRRATALDDALALSSCRAMRRASAIQDGGRSTRSIQFDHQDGADAGWRRSEIAHYRSPAGVTIGTSFLSQISLIQFQAAQMLPGR